MIYLLIMNYIIIIYLNLSVWTPKSCSVYLYNYTLVDARTSRRSKNAFIKIVSIKINSIPNIIICIRIILRVGLCGKYNCII